MKWIICAFWGQDLELLSETLTDDVEKHSRDMSQLPASFHPPIFQTLHCALLALCAAAPTLLRHCDYASKGFEERDTRPRLARVLQTLRQLPLHFLLASMVEGVCRAWGVEAPDDAAVADDFSAEFLLEEFEPWKRSVRVLRTALWWCWPVLRPPSFRWDVYDRAGER
jgi:hypothetical protein